jgi:catechol 2,3-dioxygenase-like lactoylglutathione lyase family enzyme
MQDEILCVEANHKPRFDPIMNLNQVTLPARNIVESVAFYTNMGFTHIVESGHYARFLCPDGNATFSLHHTTSIDASSDTVVYFECEDLDAQVSELQRRGFTFFQEPRSEDWLWREARLHDPTGNVICLYFAGDNRINPPWRINPSPNPSPNSSAINT